MVSGADGTASDDLRDLSTARRAVLLSGVFLVASCGLAYEIVGGAVSTYLLGDGVLQFSLTIGIFLSAMGVGSFLSRWVTRRLLLTFVSVEIGVAVVGGAIAPTLLWAYTEGVSYVPVLVAMLGGVGVLTGMEIPLVLRLLERHETLRTSAAAVLGLDYVGALVASLVVPVLLMPHVGTIGASALFGLLNLAVAAAFVWGFPETTRTRAGRRAMVGLLVALAIPMGIGAVRADAISRALERNLYQDPVVYANQTPFQRIVLTRWRGDLRMFLNGSLQFSSRDEYRYHEALVHPAMARAPRHDRVLLLGGGDGLAVREVLRWDDVGHVDLVDLDPEVTRLARSHPDLAALNEGSLDDPRVTVHHGDALKHLEDEAPRPYDVVVMDLPDPSTSSLSRLYARSSLRLVARHLAADGVLVTQATSPFFAREAFWCIHDTMDGLVAGGPGGPRLQPHPYRVTVPSFGLWGFVLATAGDFDPAAQDIPVPTRHVTGRSLPALFAFPPDEAHPAGGRCVNHLNDAVLARVYRAGWERFGE
ncbi:MAG: polyamine aminopropyltransferase [Myxococcota bacterium]